MGKSTWFKGGGGKISNTGTPSGGYWKRGSKNDNTGTGPLRTRTVLFVENTPNGELSKRIREQLARMEGIMGYKMKVVERVGTQLKDLFSLTNVWGGTVCGRNNCTTCLQDCEEVQIVPEEVWYTRVYARSVYQRLQSLDLWVPLRLRPHVFMWGNLLGVFMNVQGNTGMHLEQGNQTHTSGNTIWYTIIARGNQR